MCYTNSAERLVRNILLWSRSSSGEGRNKFSKFFCSLIDGRSIEVLRVETWCHPSP